MSVYEKSLNAVDKIFEEMSPGTFEKEYLLCRNRSGALIKDVLEDEQSKKNEKNEKNEKKRN